MQIRQRPNWEWLPFRFERLGGGRVVVTNAVGEFLLLSELDFDRFISKDIDPEERLAVQLRSRHFIQEARDALPLELLTIKSRARLQRLPDFTSLHLFVVTLRCDHTCQYCQVSRQNVGAGEFDMSADDAEIALQHVFRSPAPTLKIEFQGGEPLLNWGMVETVVTRAEQLNDSLRPLAFVVTSNLSQLDAPILKFAREHDVYFSTSLDGPQDLHNANRPRPGNDSFERTVEGINRIRQELGSDRVGALMTTTTRSLDRPHDIIDAYLGLGLTEVFLRPLSPYGFAARRGPSWGYETQRWLSFYETGLDYCIEKALSGHDIIERHAAIILKKMLTNEDPGYVDLTSPAGLGTRCVVYNYDGSVYASDEARMLAEMGDSTFRLGQLGTDSYEDLFTNDTLLDAIDLSFANSVPMCTDCAFEPWCGSDPVYHHATLGDFVGRKPESGFCRRNMGIFKTLLDRYERDPATRRLFEYWAQR